MNLTYYELRASLKSSIIFAITLIGSYALLMLGAYPAYSSAADEITALLANYPPEFIAAFGMNIESLFSFGGFYNFSFGYIGLIGAIMASSLSISVFAREKRSKCLDFLLTKPIKRENVFIYKLFSCIAILVITNILYIISMVILYNANSDTSTTLGTLVFAGVGLFFTQLVFLAFGIAYAIFSKKVRSVAGTATAFGFGAFILSSISNVFDDKNIEYLAPLKYFEPNAVFMNQGYDIKLVITATLIIVICIAISFVKFCKSDTHAV